MNTAQQRRGFTLVELLVVLAIMGILVGLLVSVYIRAQEGARVRGTWALIRRLALACEQYQIDWNAPLALDADPAENFEAHRALTAPVSLPTSQGPPPLSDWPPEFLNSRGSMIDRWGTPFRFKIETSPGGKPRLKVYSCGPNGEDDDGGGDDLPPETVTSE